MKLYHGTNIDFSEIDLSKCKPNKDFGQGFYLTNIEQQAEKQAVRRCNSEGSGTPIVQTYEFNEGYLTDKMLTKQEIQFIIDCIVEDLVSFLMHDYKLSIIDAFDKVYNSKIYQKLLDKNTELYMRSSLYNYAYLKEELNTQTL